MNTSGRRRFKMRSSPGMQLGQESTPVKCNDGKYSICDRFHHSMITYIAADSENWASLSHDQLYVQKL